MNYAILSKTGRLPETTSEKQHGIIYHAIPENSYAALCGDKPGKRSDWSSYEGKAVTCERCLKMLDR